MSCPSERSPQIIRVYLSIAEPINYSALAFLVWVSESVYWRKSFTLECWKESRGAQGNSLQGGSKQIWFLFLHSTFHTISTLPSFIPHSVFICRLSSRSPILSALSLHLLEHSSLTSLPLSVVEWKQQVSLSPSKFAGFARSKTGGSGLCCYFRCNK